MRRYILLQSHLYSPTKQKDMYGLEIPEEKPTEVEVIQNSLLEFLYSHEFGEGRFFQVVFEDDDEVRIQIASRTMMKVIYIKDRDDIEGIEIVKLIRGEETQRLRFSKFNLQQLKAFLRFIDELDLKGIAERRIQLADDSLDLIDTETRKKVATLLSGQEGAEMIRELLDQGIITSHDLVNTGYRKRQLQTFDHLLHEEGYLQTYKAEVLDTPDTKDEIAWQRFFEMNPWIFGYGLDYRFQAILQREFAASNTTAAGKEQVNGDFLLGDHRFTTFVELKKPDTPLFGRNKNRSGSWCLSQDLNDAVSHILEQKAAGQLKLETAREVHDQHGNLITQHAYDPKVILVIGHWEQVEQSDASDHEKQIKCRTFELYRRNSRNVEIITYDELYDRARHIVEHQRDN